MDKRWIDGLANIERYDWIVDIVTMDTERINRDVATPVTATSCVEAINQVLTEIKYLEPKDIYSVTVRRSSYTT